MFAEALILPIRHPLRALAHGLGPCILLLAGTFLFPGVTLLGQPTFVAGLSLATPEWDGRTWPMVIGLANFAITVLMMLWCVSLSALALRAWDPEGVDPATFD